MLPFIVLLGLQLAAARPLIPPDCWVYRTLDARFRLEIVAKGLKIPVSLAFLPDRRHALLAERPTGRLSILDLATGATVTVSGTPKVFGQTDGGLQDVGSSRVDLQACKLEYSIVSPK